MVVATTTNFDLDIPDLVEEAFERCGLEVRTGYDMRTARRSLNLMMTDWANRGINLWTVEQREQALSDGIDSYTLGTDIIDLIEHVIRLPMGSGTVQQTDYQISRISVSTYATRTSKLTRSRPTEIYIDRQREAPRVTLWPVPDDTGYVLVYWFLRRIFDVGEYTNTMALPFRFLEPLAAGLAFYIAQKKPDSANRVDALEQRYERAFARAAMEDREKAPTRLIPHRMY